MMCLNLSTLQTSSTFYPSSLEKLHESAPDLEPYSCRYVPTAMVIATFQRDYLLGTMGLFGEHGREIGKIGKVSKAETVRIVLFLASLNFFYTLAVSPFPVPLPKWSLLDIIPAFCVVIVLDLCLVLFFFSFSLLPSKNTGTEYLQTVDSYICVYVCTCMYVYIRYI